jgi:hypothetical protein
MKRAGLWFRGLTASVCLAAAWGASAADAAGSCEREVSGASSGTARHYLVLAASRDVFYNKSGPSFVMLVKTGAGQETEMGAVGIYADDQRRVAFGSVPWQAYDAFLRDPVKRPSDVMLRLEIREAQYERIFEVLQSWDRRARENELLYKNDVYMNNILLVKQATDELNRCRQAVDLYRLDWGLDDKISDENARSIVPFLVFQELKRRNASLHIPDSKMPNGLLALAGSEPLSAKQPAPPVEKEAVRAPDPAHAHHHH